MPVPRAGLGASTLNGKIYVTGGFDPAAGIVLFARVDVYDPATNTWTREADVLGEKSTLATSVVGDKIYVIDGEKEWWKPKF